jgi:hypothetical protein
MKTKKQPRRAVAQRAKPRSSASGKHCLHIARESEGWSAEPLQTITLTGAAGGTVVVSDGTGREYARLPGSVSTTFQAAGSLGTHTARLVGRTGKTLGTLRFAVDARTKIDDEGGTFRDLSAILDKTMRCYGPEGTGSITWRGREYRFYVHWILDHSHTAKGMQYYSGHTAGLVDMLAKVQRSDGMIWSNVNPDRGPGYFDSAYGADGYAQRGDGLLLVRQPVENHCEYNYVDAMWLAWKGSGDDAWMKNLLPSAAKALDYGVTDRARYSTRFGLLKRGYTIDSWDFQVDDKYTVRMDLATAQRIDPDRTKFGVFHGDNQGYALACFQLAEMLAHADRKVQAAKYRRRGEEIHERLDAIAWNGRFYTHRVEEDDSVKRDLGVDETSQMAMSNCYAINRGISHEHAVAVLRTYRDLKAHLPSGSPGEWYAIYPPFGRGFGHDNGKWQYMNGGVHGHAAGELARGAFEHGFELYGADILRRLRELARRTNGTVAFAYTGAYEPPPPPQVFTTLDLKTHANMDLWDKGASGVPCWMADKKGNDVRKLPLGEQTFADIPFHVVDPAANGRKAAVGVSLRDGFAATVEVPVNKTAGALYLLHAVSRIGPSRVAGTVTFRYDDGSEHAAYVMAGEHVTGWWFPELKGTAAGVAWRGANPCSSDVGLSWCALSNPHADKRIRGIVFGATAEGAIYAVVAATLADRPPYTPANPVSFGGPDNWSGGLCMYALMEGLAGVKDETTAFDRVRLSPRWSAADVARVAVTARYGASKGYVSYRYQHDATVKTVSLTLTGSGRTCAVRVLLPAKAAAVSSVSVDGKAVVAKTETVEKSLYAVVPVAFPGPVTLNVVYAD